jgi:hypothetical protein
MRSAERKSSEESKERFDIKHSQRGSSNTCSMKMNFNAHNPNVNNFRTPMISAEEKPIEDE